MSNPVFNFEEKIEGAVASMLVAAGVPAYAPRGSNNVPRTHVLVEFNYAGASSPQDQLSRRWPINSGSLRISIRTQRELNPRNEIVVPLTADIRTLHASYLVTVRTLMTESSFAIPEYQIRSIRPAGTDRDYSAENIEDVTVESFDIQFTILRADLSG